MTPLRIGWMIYGSLGTMSGGYLYDRIMVEGLRAAGHKVEVISLPDVPWFSAVTHNWDNDLLYETLDLDLDILVQDELNHPSLFWFNRRLRKQSQIPIVALIHHLRSSERHFPPFSVLYRGVEKSYLESVHAFSFNSSHTRLSVDALSPILSRPWAVAHPGKDRLGPPLEPKTVSERALTKGPLRILFVGNIIPRKGLLPLIKVLQELGNFDWEFTVIGSLAADKTYVKSIFSLLKKPDNAGKPLAQRIQFHGLKPDTEMRSYYEKADIFALPSDIEGYGIAYAEAQSFGLPCLASAKGGAGEIIAHGRNGWLVNFGDLKAINDHLLEVLLSRERLHTMSLESLENYEHLASWKSSQEIFTRFIESVKM